MSVIERCLYYRGVRKESFHCNKASNWNKKTSKTALYFTAF